MGRAGGFETGDDIVASAGRKTGPPWRVGGQPEWLDFVDRQYLDPFGARPGPRRTDLGGGARPRPTAVFLPMGLANPDHSLTHGPDCWSATP